MKYNKIKRKKKGKKGVHGRRGDAEKIELSISYPMGLLVD